jgi:hypothetical protein
MSVDTDKLEERLFGLRGERAAVAATRTREDVRALAEDWLAAACRRTNGTAGLVLNGHASPPEVLSVIAEFVLDSPDLIGFISKRVEATELSARAKKQQLAKLDAEIAAVEKDLLAVRKREALERVEAEFAGEAA